MDFKGAASYDKVKIYQALENYEETVKAFDQFKRHIWEFSCSEFKTTLWCKVWGIKTLEDKYKTDESWFKPKKSAYCLRKGYYYLTENKQQLYYKLLDWRGYYLWKEAQTQVHWLSKGEVCYLSPTQIAFVEKFLDFKVTLEELMEDNSETT